MSPRTSPRNPAILVGILLLAGAPSPAVSQVPGPAPAPAPSATSPSAGATAAQEEDLRRHLARLDSIRAEIERVSQEQMEAIRRITESRQTEMNALREQLNAQSQSLQDAQRQLSETERRISDAQRGEIEQVRARMLEESRRLSEAAGELARLQGSRAVRIGPGTELDPWFRSDQPAFFADSVFREFRYAVPSWAPPTDGAVTLYREALSPQWEVFNIGLRAVAGAELAELNPSLARYFEVDGGVLVTEVAEGSPAATAGLQPGDVIVEAGGNAVTTVEELRSVVSGANLSRIRVIQPAPAPAPAPTPPGAAAPQPSRQPPLAGGRTERRIAVVEREPVTLRVVREGEPLEVELGG